MNLIIGTLTAVVIPYLKAFKETCAKKAEEDFEGDNALFDGETGSMRLKSVVEVEFDKQPYDDMMGPFADYAELAVQFG